mgnify:CR=1
MAHDDDYELVGTVWRRKPKSPEPVWPWVVGAFVLLIMLGQCAG